MSQISSVDGHFAGSLTSIEFLSHGNKLVHRPYFWYLYFLKYFLASHCAHEALMETVSQPEHNRMSHVYYYFQDLFYRLFNSQPFARVKPCTHAAYNLHLAKPNEVLTISFCYNTCFFSLPVPKISLQTMCLYYITPSAADAPWWGAGS